MNLIVLCVFVISFISNSSADLASLMLSKPEGDRRMSVSEIITYHGYPVETHTVTTEDGYILTLQRIPYGKQGQNSTFRQPVVLQHGLLCSSVIWVWNTPDRNLAYILADKGFDVWLSNIRGNEYGLNHRNLNTDDSKFWDFSWDEMAKYDMPAIIDYVLNKTTTQKLQYIGHSMGTSMMFALLSTKLEYNEKIVGFHALAPVTQLQYAKSPIKVLAATNVLPINPFLRNEQLQLNGQLFQLLVNVTCNTWNCTTNCDMRCDKCEGLAVFCESVVFVMFGPNSRQLNETRLQAVFLQYFPASTSVKTIQHYVQLMGNTYFGKFDYKLGNILHYGQATPPLYDLTKVTAPVWLYWGENDWLTDPKDVAKLPSVLPNLKVNHKIEDPMFSHGDFFWAIDGPKLCYDHVIANMNTAL